MLPLRISMLTLPCLFAAATAFAQAPQEAGKGPQIDLAPEEAEAEVPIQSPILLQEQAPNAIKKTGLFALPRQSQVDVALDPRTNRLRGAAVGGYGEAVLNAPVDGSSPTVADLRRNILFFGFNFTDRIRFFSEIEFEHALTTDGKPGEVAVEQSFLDFLAWRWLNFRAGMILIPVNLINIYHEPSTFNGVDRPDTDLYIVPSTWKQLGAGIFGALGPLRYQLYATPGLKAEGFSAQTGIRGGVQDNFVRARDWGLVGRVDYSPWLGINLGASLFWARSGQGDPNLGDAPVTVAALDGKFGRYGLSIRGQLSYVHIGDAAMISRALLLIRPGSAPVAEHLLGGYIEVGYDILRLFRSPQGFQLLSFVRYERSDTQLRVPEGELLTTALPGQERSVYTVGLVFRPIFEIAIKVDYQHRHTEVDKSNVNLLNAGIAYQF